MTIRVHAFGPRSVSIHLRPSWWERLLGASDVDDAAIALDAIGGGVIWCSDSTGRRVRDERVLAEIERSVSAY